MGLLCLGRIFREHMGTFAMGLDHKKNDSSNKSDRVSGGSLGFVVL